MFLQPGNVVGVHGKAKTLLEAASGQQGELELQCGIPAMRCKAALPREIRSLFELSAG
jgi:hypothetical protein